jgi:hypothetical protein
MNRVDEPNGWVSSDAERHRQEEELRQQLVGHRIERVRYMELRYEGHPEPMWRGARFDSLDYGLELDLDDGTTWGLIWKQQGHNEALLVYPAPLVPTQLRAQADTAVWDVTDHWGTAGPLAISTVTPTWMRHRFGPAVNQAGEQVASAGESDLCLVTLILTSDGGREAVITLGQREADGSYGHSHENVAVFFSVDEARHAHVLLPRRR